LNILLKHRGEPVALEHLPSTPHRLAGRAFGVPLEIGSNRRPLLRAMAERLPGFEAGPVPEGARRYRAWRSGRRTFVWADDRLLADQTGDAQALGAFQADAQLFVAEMAPKLVFVHAGVVGWRGRAIVIPGRSGAGKTTLVRALLERGASYLSDEYAVFDQRGRVRPYPRPLQIRCLGGRVVRRSAQSLGASREAGSIRVGLVVAVRYRSTASWQCRGTTAGRGVLALMSNAVAARRFPARTLACVARAIRAETVVLQGVRGEASAAADEIIAILEGGGRI
jgi:hypothetical protein